MDKNTRQKHILDIINNKQISTQKELTLELEKLGIQSTQATISRDIKELKLIKIQSVGSGSYYAVLEDTSISTAELLKEIASLAMLHFRIIGDNILITTVKDTAKVCSNYIESLAIPSIISIFTSSDSLILLMETDSNNEKIVEEIRKSLS